MSGQLPGLERQPPVDFLWPLLATVALFTVSWLGWRLAPLRRYPPQTTEQRLNEADAVTRVTRHF